jgi:hypothetical protein
VKNMKNGIYTIASPFTAPTTGVFQGTTAPSAVRSTGIVPGFGGAGLRLRARDLTVAPDSVAGGPVI